MSEHDTIIRYVADTVSSGALLMAIDKAARTYKNRVSIHDDHFGVRRLYEQMREAVSNGRRGMASAHLSSIISEDEIEYDFWMSWCPDCGVPPPAYNKVFG